MKSGRLGPRLAKGPIMVSSCIRTDVSGKMTPCMVWLLPCDLLNAKRVPREIEPQTSWPKSNNHASKPSGPWQVCIHNYSAKKQLSKDWPWPPLLFLPIMVSSQASVCLVSSRASVCPMPSRFENQICQFSNLDAIWQRFKAKSFCEYGTSGSVIRQATARRDCSTIVEFCDIYTLISKYLSKIKLSEFRI